MKRAFLPILALALVAPLGAAHEDGGGPICVLHVWGDFSPAAMMNTARSLIKQGKDKIADRDFDYVEWERAYRDICDARATLREIKKEEVTPEVEPEVLACREEVEAALDEILVPGFLCCYNSATRMIDSPSFAQANLPLGLIEPVLIERNKDGRFDGLIDRIEEARKTIYWIFEDAGIEYLMDRETNGF